MAARRLAMGEFAALVGLGLRCIVNDYDFFGQAITVKGAPVRLAGTATFARGMVISKSIGIGSSSRGRHCRTRHDRSKTIFRPEGRCVALCVKVSMGRGERRLI